MHAVAALVRTMAPLTRRCGWGTQDPTKNSEHHNTTMLRSGRCGHKDKRTKNTTWMHIGWELKLSFLFGGGTHGFAASKHPTWPLAPWPLRGPPWPKTTRRFVVRILPPPPPPPSVMVGVDLKGFCIHVVLSPEQPSMLKAKVLKTTSSTLINYAKVLRSHTRTSVYVQPSRVKCEPLRINIKQTVWHGHHVKCSHHPCTEPTSCQHCSRRGLKKAHGACDWRRRRRRLGATGKLLELLVPPVSGTDHFGIANWLGKQLVPLVLYSSMTSRWIVLARSQASQPMWKSASKNSGS